MKSTTVKMWEKTRRLLRLISAYEDKPMTAILHEMASDRIQQIKPPAEGKSLKNGESALACANSFIKSLDVLFNGDDK